MSATGQMWLCAVLVPAFTFFSQNMCVWRAPRFLGTVAFVLLWLWASTLVPVLAAFLALIYFVADSLIYGNTDGELVRRVSMASSCLCCIGLWILAIYLAVLLRRRAFVRASRVGDRLARALAHYGNDKGEYPESLDRLNPDYLEEIPYTGMIAYPEFSYFKDRNDNETVPGSFELRIDCTSGGINFDRFIYWPCELYPDQIQGKPVERIQKWAYVHE